MLKDTIAEHWSRTSAGYDRTVWNRDVRKGREAWLSLLGELLGGENLEILDVGTGPGVMALLLAELGHRVTGIDLSREMLARARDNAARLGHEISFMYGDAEKVPFPDNTFDAVINRHLLWTLPDPQKAIAGWKRVLRPGGRLIIIDGNWYPNMEGSLKNRLWRYAAASLVLLTEGRNIFGRRNYPYNTEEGKASLPLMYAWRPEEDLKIIRRVGGLHNVSVTEGINRLTQTRLDHFKFGYQGDSYCISTQKDE